MEQEIYTLLIQYGGGAAVIVALIFFLKELKSFLYKRNGNGHNKRIEDLEKQLSNDLVHELGDIKRDINDLQKWTRDYGERLAKLETKIK